MQNSRWESSSDPGFALGLSVGFPVSKRFLVQPEVLYMEKGSSEYDPATNTEYNLTLDYIEVPVLAKYRLLTSGTIRPHLFAGPYAAFLIENHSDLERPQSSTYTPDQLVQTARDTEFGAAIGLGTDLHFTFNTMSIELRYNAGLSDVFDAAQEETIRNGALIFMVGFSF